MSRLMRFPTAVRDDPAVARWMQSHPGELGALALRWFTAMRACGDDVRELLHDGCPTACVGDAAFAYVGVFTAHANVGFFLGAELPDPQGLLEGTGRFMRHVKLRPGRAMDEPALEALVGAAHRDIRARLAAPAGEHCFDVFGRRILLRRQAGAWQAFAVGNDGKRAPAGLVVPEFVAPDELEQYLFDLLHESATPGRGDVRRIG